MDLDYKNPYSRKWKKFKPTPFLGPSSQHKSGYVSHYAEKVRITSVIITFICLYILYFTIQTLLFYLHFTDGCSKSWHYYINYIAFYCRSDPAPFETAFLRFLGAGMALVVLYSFIAVMLRLQAKYKTPLPRWVVVLFFLSVPFLLLGFIYVGYLFLTR